MKRAAILILLVLACDDRSVKALHTSDACLHLAERAIGECMDTKGSGAVNESRVRFCTEQYVAIVHACRCEPADSDEVAAPAPRELELSESP